MRMRWLVSVFLGLALLTGQAASLTMGPLTMGHVSPAYAKDLNKGDSGDAPGRGDGTGGGFHEGGSKGGDHGHDHGTDK